METKNPLSSKLYWVGILLALGPMVDPLRDFVMQLIQMLPPERQALAVSALGIVIMVLRHLTTAAVSFKAPVKPQ